MLVSIDQLLHDFDISHYGFLPIEEPLSKLPDAYYQPWESLIIQLPQLIQAGCLYDEFALLPLLDTSRLHAVPEWRRAYVILTFFTHAHTWSGQKPHEILPHNIAIPLLVVSEHLGLPPTATYPALNLWNCGLSHDGADITNPENVVMRHTFTGTPDEAWFYAVSVSVEAKGIRAIQVMLECVEAVDSMDESKVLECLKVFGNIVSELGVLLQRMHEHCDPAIFYHHIRPFLAGSRGMEKIGLPRGVFYDEGDGRGTWRQYSGGSNAQSTLIQFLDIALGVEHRAPGSTSAAQSEKRHTYLDEMRKYMPQSHRHFLEHFSSMANVRAYMQQASPDSDVRKVFDAAVDAMTAFRDLHIKIVARYIVAPSRQPTAGRDDSVKNIASASSKTSTDRAPLKGTGGTDLMTFLKQTRDETRAARTPELVAMVS